MRRQLCYLGRLELLSIDQGEEFLPLVVQPDYDLGTCPRIEPCLIKVTVPLGKDLFLVIKCARLGEKFVFTCLQ